MSATAASRSAAGLFPIDRARSLDSWHVTGMRATGSSDHAFDDVVVAEDWTFEPLRPAPTSGVHGAIPLWAQLGGGLAACAVGAARNMIDRFVELAATKVPAGGNFSRLAERAPAQIAAGEAEGLYLAARAVLHESTERVWARGLARRPFDNAALAEQRLATVTAVRLAAQAIDCLHDAAGMSSVKSDAVLERCWRDVHTMTQHLILVPGPLRDRRPGAPRPRSGRPGDLAGRVDVAAVAPGEADQGDAGGPSGLDRERGRGAHREHRREPRGPRLLHDLEAGPAAHEQAEVRRRGAARRAGGGRPPCPPRCGGRRPRGRAPADPPGRRRPPRARRRSPRTGPAPAPRGRPPSPARRAGSPPPLGSGTSRSARSASEADPQSPHDDVVVVSRGSGTRRPAAGADRHDVEAAVDGGAESRSSGRPRPARRRGGRR